MAPTMRALSMALLASQAAGAALHRERPSLEAEMRLPPLHRRTVEANPMVMFAEDCKLRSQANQEVVALNRKRAEAAAANPGAGLEPFTPYEKVLKDGFYLVECVKDKLLSYGDKFGNGAQAYNMGSVSNVSIVHYTEVVPKEDQQAMSHETCFMFCRTVPDMNFFGIHNGRDCYCAPYYQAMESDSSMCDAVCEGSPTQMCGGKTKSSIFGMHACANTATLMQEHSQKATTAEGILSGQVTELSAVASSMQSTAEKLQATLGQAGDPAASDLMQAAKVFAGELEHAAEEKQKVSADILAATAEVTSLAQADLTTFANAEKAEDVTDRLALLTASAEAAAKEVTELLALAKPVDDDDEVAPGVVAQYYPLMYFVDKAYNSTATTCSGDALKKPMAMTSEQECAKACDDNFQTCVGYSYYPGELCFMFSKFKEVTYYAGCDGSAEFLQVKREGESEPFCKAKLSKFEGTSVAPDASGKCAGCLKKATKADRCPFGQ